MERKTLIWIGLSLGSALGSYIPVLWGDNMFSLWSVVLSGLGGFAGIYLGYKLGQ